MTAPRKREDYVTVRVHNRDGLNDAEEASAPSTRGRKHYNPFLAVWLDAYTRNDQFVWAVNIGVEPNDEGETVVTVWLQDRGASRTIFHGTADCFLDGLKALTSTAVYNEKRKDQTP